MHRVVNLQNRINQLTTQFSQKTARKTKRHPVLYAIAGFLIAFTLITSTPLCALTYPFSLPFYATGGPDLQRDVWNAINLIVSAVIGVVLYLVIAKAADTSRARRNVYIDNNNAVVDANNQALAQSIEQAKQEMVNLYETEMDQRRMEAGQQEMLNQQRIGNMLQIGNLFMQGQILNQAQQINANTASTSRNVDWIARDVFGKRNGL